MNITKSDILTEIKFIDHGFFDRTGGESTGKFESLNVGINRGDENALNNREKIAEYFGVSLSDLVILNQKHGDVVHIITEENLEQYKFKSIDQALKNEGDAIITNIKNLLIGVNTADCAPILLCDKDLKYIAVIHAGWRGSNGQIIENTIEKMKFLGCKNIIAAIGPCLQKRYFEIKSNTNSQIDRKYISFIGEKALFDMQRQVLEKLMKSGVKSVSKLNIDTISNNNYFSYRRLGENCGLQFSGIIIKE